MSGRDYIQKTPLQHVGEGVLGKRSITDLSKKIEEVSRQISADERPHLSSRFIEHKQGDSSTTVDLTAVDPTDPDKAYINGVVHGLGRKYRGWQIAGRDAPASVYEASATEIDTYNIDTTVYLPLKCTEDVTIKLVVW